MKILMVLLMTTLCVSADGEEFDLSKQLDGVTRFHLTAHYSLGDEEVDVDLSRDGGHSALVSIREWLGKGTYKIVERTSDTAPNSMAVAGTMGIEMKSPSGTRTLRFFGNEIVRYVESGARIVLRSTISGSETYFGFLHACEVKAAEETRRKRADESGPFAKYPKSG